MPEMDDEIYLRKADFWRYIVYGACALLVNLAIIIFSAGSLFVEVKTLTGQLIKVEALTESVIELKVTLREGLGAGRLQSVAEKRKQAEHWHRQFHYDNRHLPAIED
jgi:hypothetical protein